MDAVISLFFVMMISFSFLLYTKILSKYTMTLSLVKLHKQPKGLGERPVPGR